MLSITVLLIYLLIASVIGVALFFIIKNAVKSAIKEVNDEKNNK